jgi:hypothetical protein
MPLEDATQWTFEPAPAPIPAPPPMPAAAPQRATRPDRGADALSGLAAELSMRANGHGDHAPDHPRTPSFEPLGPAPHADVPAAASADQNLVDMAHRLEAALRTPAPEPRPVTPARNANGSARPAGEAPQVRPEPRLSAPPAPSAEDKKAFGSLEEEMASLLGRKG